MNNKTGKILFVDDDAAIRESAKYFLETAGYAVACGRDGEDALRLFARETFGLVIVDIAMPGINGLDAISAMKKKDPCCRIVAISGAADLKDMFLDAAEILGATKTLSKPFSRAQLLACVAEQSGP